MRIAPRYDAEDWIALRLDDPERNDWPTALRIFDGRIRERYIDPIDFLIAEEERKPAVERRFGFAVLAIDCLLVETLGAFIEGLEDTEGKSQRVFVRFLTTRPAFSSYFTKDLARQFYSEFRCGILHQAEVGGDSRVWSVGPLISTSYKSLVVNRNEFHARLKAEFARYIEQLDDSGSVDLRTNFRKKMNFIARHDEERA